MSTQVIGKETRSTLKAGKTSDTVWAATIPLQVQNLAGSPITGLEIVHLWQSGQVAEQIFVMGPIGPTAVEVGAINSGSGGYDDWIVFFYLGGILQSTGLVDAQVYQPSNPTQPVQVQIQKGPNNNTVTFTVNGADTTVNWQVAYNAFTVVTT